MDDTRQLRERWIGDLVFADDGFEAASSIDMAELDVWHVIRNRLLALGGRHDVGGRYKQELGFWVDKSLDEPGAGDPIDIRIRAGDVFHDRPAYPHPDPSPPPGEGNRSAQRPKKGRLQEGFYK